MIAKAPESAIFEEAKPKSLSFRLVFLRRNFFSLQLKI